MLHIWRCLGDNCLMCCPQLRDWLMEKDVVKVMKKGKRGKGYKYSKLPKDISTSMKHLE